MVFLNSRRSELLDEGFEQAIITIYIFKGCDFEMKQVLNIFLWAGIVILVAGHSYNFFIVANADEVKIETKLIFQSTEGQKKEAKLISANQHEIIWRRSEVATSNVLADGDRGVIYYTDSSGNLLKINHKGQLVWSVQLEEKSRYHLQLDNKGVLVSSENTAYRVNEKGVLTGTSPLSEKISLIPEVRLKDQHGNQVRIDNSKVIRGINSDGEEWLTLDMTSAGQEELQIQLLAGGELIVASQQVGIFCIGSQRQGPELYIEGSVVYFPDEFLVDHGHTYAPLRHIAEASGTEIQWEEATETISLNHNQTTILLKPNTPTAVINGQEVQLKTVPIFVQGRIMIPIREFFELLEAKVYWELATSGIYVFKSNFTE